MPSVNKVIVLGNVGKDPEIRYLPNGDAACNISVATTRSWKDKNSGEKQEETEWHRVSFFGRLAEIVGEYVQKGKPIYVEGRLKTRKYTDKDGAEKYATEIIADQLQLLGGRDDGGGQQRGQAQQQRGASQARAPAPRQQSQRATGGGGGGGGGGPGDWPDEDIPFVFADYSTEISDRKAARIRGAR